MDDQTSSGNASVSIGGSNLGTELQTLLMADSIQPGTTTSYELCKVIYLFHPLGAKMVELPLAIAQSQEREIKVGESPEDRVVQAFKDEWKKIKADTHIFNVMRLSRIYGVASLVYGSQGIPTDRPIPLKDLYKEHLYFNVLDPLNTSGSLVLNQDPNAPDFQKYASVSVQGKPYHRSRSCVVLNEEPIYIAYTVSAFGYVGRSVYQRALFPLKSFVQSMITDDLVTKKAGLLIAMIKAVGSVADKVMMGFTMFKRSILKEAQTGNVISVGADDKIESLNMQNADTAMTTARKNILENIAAANGMPAQLLNNETMAQGFGEGSEDAKNIARYIDGIRADMQPVYEFFDELVMYRAWNPEFYKTIQLEFPEDYGSMPYLQAFYKWKNSFRAVWPNLLIEPESERIKIDDTRMKTLISVIQTFLPLMDPENKGNLMQWAQDNINENPLLFKHELTLDIDAFKDFAEEQQDRMAQQQEQEAQDKKSSSTSEGGPGTQAITMQPGGAGTPGQADQQLLEKAPPQKLAAQKLSSPSWGNH